MSELCCISFELLWCFQFPKNETKRMTEPSHPGGGWMVLVWHPAVLTSGPTLGAGDGFTLWNQLSWKTPSLMTWDAVPYSLPRLLKKEIITFFSSRFLQFLHVSNMASGGPDNFRAVVWTRDKKSAAAPAPLRPAKVASCLRTELPTVGDGGSCGSW